MYKKERLPKRTTITVCAVHIIQPNANAGLFGTLYKTKALATKTGYVPNPPFVRAILNPPTTKPTIIASNGKFVVSGKAKVTA